MNFPFPRKFYLRREELKPDTAAQNAIRQGLWMQGVEIVDFIDAEEIKTFDDLGPDVGVAGYVSDVLLALQHLGIDPPLLLDYPNELRKTPICQRMIHESTLGKVRNGTCQLMGWVPQVFIKPSQDHKLFTGFVWSEGGTKEQRFQLAPLSDFTPVWVSEVVNFVSEYRVFILNNQILDCRRYKGDWSKAPNHHAVEAAVELMAPKAPMAYCLDVGVVENEAFQDTTLLVEVNDGFAFGGYGLAPPQYACMIAARWRQLCS